MAMDDSFCRSYYGLIASSVDFTRWDENLANIPIWSLLNFRIRRVNLTGSVHKGYVCGNTDIKEPFVVNLKDSPTLPLCLHRISNR
jgi:hypothetical protein